MKSKPHVVEGASATAAVMSPSLEMVNRRGLESPRTHGVSRHPPCTCSVPLRAGRPHRPRKSPSRIQGAGMWTGWDAGTVWDAGTGWDTGTGWDVWMRWGPQMGSLLFCCLPGSGVNTCSAMTLAVFDLGEVCLYWHFHPQVPATTEVAAIPGCARPAWVPQSITGLPHLVFNGSLGRKALAVFLEALLLSVLTHWRRPTPRHTSSDLNCPTSLPTLWLMPRCHL